MKKGFTLIELIVSFTLITVVSISLFKTVLSVQQKQSQNIAINKFKAFQLLLNNEIENDFLKEEIESVNECGINCYDIQFKEIGIKRLSIDKVDNVITYGSFKEKLPDNYKLIDDITITKYESTTSGINSYIFLDIPIKSSLEPSLNSLKYMYTYDSIGKDISGNVESNTFQYNTLERNLLLSAYPVGSIYTSTSSINPGTLFGGTWIAYGTGRVLVGVDDTDTDFNASGKTGGTKYHQHSYGLQYGGWWGQTEIENATSVGLLNYSSNSEFIITGHGESAGSETYQVNNALTTSLKSGGEGGVLYKMEANMGSTSILQPYITIYRFRRTN